MVNKVKNIDSEGAFQGVFQENIQGVFQERFQEFQGGCLQNYLIKWEKLGAPAVLLKILKGYRIPFKAKPPLYTMKEIQDQFQTLPSPEMDIAIQTLLDQNILESAPITPSFISSLFLIPKVDGGTRCIFNLKRLNSFVTTTKFRLISVNRIRDFLQKEDWLVKIDLTQAYYHLGIAPGHRCFLRLSYRGHLYQMTCLPFGLASAPKVFASLTNWTAEILREKGIRIVVFLDDFLLVAQDKQTIIRHRDIVLQTLRQLGWHVNYRKSILIPQTALEYLGLIWDPWNNLVSLPEKKIQRLEKDIAKLLQRKKASLHDIQSIIGQMNFARLAVPLGRLNFHHLLLHCNLLLKLQSLQAYRLTPEVIEELNWWLKHCHGKSCLHPPPVKNFLTTDAADFGWGADLNGTHLKGMWTAIELRLHSNHKEMLTVLKVLLEYAPILSQASLLLQCDNKAVVAYLKKEGGTKSKAMMDLTYQIFQILQEYNIFVMPHHIPGRYNTTADSLSRRSILPEWHLLPEVTDVVFMKWGVPDVDLFASSTAHVVPRYVTLDQRDQMAWRHNAFAITWNFRIAWVFPPPNLMPRVLMHLNQATGIFLVVAPRWPRAFWRADLKARATAPPFILHNLGEVLLDTATNRPPPKIEDLTLEIWRCGGGQKR